MTRKKKKTDEIDVDTVIREYMEVRNKGSSHPRYWYTEASYSNEHSDGWTNHDGMAITHEDFPSGRQYTGDMWNSEKKKNRRKRK